MTLNVGTGNGTTNALLVKAALQSSLQTAPALSGTDIFWGPNPRAQSTKLVLLGAIRWDADDWKTNKTRQETFTIELFCEVVSTASTPFDVETQTLVLSNAIEAYCKANPGFGLPCVVSSSYAPGHLLSYPADDRWVGQIHAELRVTARV